MMKPGLNQAALAAAMLLIAACSGITGNRTADSAIVGAGAGAGAGAVIPGVSTVEGAAIGAAAGGIYGAVTKDKRNHEYCAERHRVDSDAYRRCRDGD